ncbi:MAG: glycosyltransferase family 4 protein [Actinomycetota bacterium]|nr:glycosyltransferase family 4 protein [Actinomycetota bacterium]
MLLPSRRVLEAIERTCRSHHTNKVLLGTPWPLLLLGPNLRRRGLRYSVIAHGAELIAPGATPGVSRRVSAALAGADLILPVSHHTAEKVGALLIKHGRSLPRIEVLRPRVDLTRFHPGVSTAALRKRLNIRDGTPVILSFGRLVPRKGNDRLLAAMREVRERIPSAVLVIAGIGPEERKLRHLARADHGVIFTGRVRDVEAPALYATADVFALPVADRWFGLEMEGLGVVLLEAAAAGTPCVTGRSGGTPEAVLDAVTGFVIDAREGAQLVEKITWLLENPTHADQMGIWGRVHVEREFSGASLPLPLLEWLSGIASRS